MAPDTKYLIFDQWPLHVTLTLVLQIWVLRVRHCVMMVNISTKSFQNLFRNNNVMDRTKCAHARTHTGRLNTMPFQWWGYKNGSHGGHLRFPIGIILAIFYLQVSHLNASYQVSIDLLVQEKRKIDFQDGGHDGLLGFWIGKILAIFEQAKKQKIEFQDGLWIYDRNYLAFFDLQLTRHFVPNSSQLAIQFRRSKK